MTDGEGPDEQNQVTTPIEDRVATHDEFTSDSKTCPECGAPIENVRVTCPKCGYEYSDADYDDDQAGREFRAGVNVDENGGDPT